MYYVCFRKLLRNLHALALLLVLWGWFFQPGCSKTASTEEYYTRDRNCENVLCRLSRYDLQVETKDWPSTEKMLTDDVSFIGRIPQETDLVSDGVRYYLYRELDGGCFWIEVTGGFLGQDVKWYGPFTLEEDGKISLCHQ